MLHQNRQKNSHKGNNNKSHKQPIWQQQGWGRGWDQDLIFVQLAMGIRG